MSIQDHKWSDDDLSFDSLDIIDGEKTVWITVDDSFRMSTAINLDISDVKALAAHFELDVDHKAALAEKDSRIAELEEELKTSNERQQHYRDGTETLADEIETLNDDIDGLLLGDES